MLVLFRLLKRTAPALFFLVMLGSALDGGASALLMYVINSELPSPNASGIVQFVIAIVLVSGGTFLLRTALVVLSKRLARLQTRRIVDVLIRSPLRNMEQIGSSKILNVLLSDIPVFATAAGTNLPAVASNVMIVVGCVGYLVWLS